MKNQLESKHGDNWFIEGNLLEHAFYDIAVGQDTIFQITLAGNQSGDLDPMNYDASTTDWVIRNNIIRHGAKAFVVVGKTFVPTQAILRHETSGLGKGARGRGENNLIYDIGSSYWTNANIGSAFMNQHSSFFAWSHNTVVDVKQSLRGTGQNTGIDVSANIFFPYLGTSWTINTDFPAVSADSVLDWVGAIAFNPPYFDGASSTFLRNVIANRNGQFFNTSIPADYPSPNYLNVHNVGDRTPEGLFESYAAFTDYLTRDWTAANYRVKAARVSEFPTLSGRVVGADIDEIEALTGVHGADVIAGIPAFAERSHRLIVPSTTTADLSYIPNGSSCSVRVWPNSAYSGTPTVDTTDAGATVAEGRRSLSLTGLTTATQYYGKRTCGTAVDVFSFKTR